MIPVVPASEPKHFNASIRVRGLRAISEMVGEVPAVPRTAGKKFKKLANRKQDIPSGSFPAYWTEALDDLMTGYENICAYSCFRIHPVTGGRSVDHMAPKSRAWDRVYEWDNYRLACSLLNASKRDFGDVLDPFHVQDGWFELELVGFQVKPAGGLSIAVHGAIQNTIDRLRLNNFRKARERDAENYWAEEISLDILTEESPFVAKELRRQGRLVPGDA